MTQHEKATPKRIWDFLAGSGELQDPMSVGAGSQWPSSELHDRPPYQQQLTQHPTNDSQPHQNTNRQWRQPNPTYSHNDYADFPSITDPRAYNYNRQTGNPRNYNQQYTHKKARRDFNKAQNVNNNVQHNYQRPYYNEDSAIPDDWASEAQFSRQRRNFGQPYNQQKRHYNNQNSQYNQRYRNNNQQRYHNRDQPPKNAGQQNVAPHSALSEYQVGGAAGSIARRARSEDNFAEYASSIPDKDLQLQSCSADILCPQDDDTDSDDGTFEDYANAELRSKTILQELGIENPSVSEKEPLDSAGTASKPEQPSPAGADSDLIDNWEQQIEKETEAKMNAPRELHLIMPSGKYRSITTAATTRAQLCQLIRSQFPNEIDCQKHIQVSSISGGRAHAIRNHIDPDTAHKALLVSQSHGNPKQVGPVFVPSEGMVTWSIVNPHLIGLVNFLEKTEFSRLKTMKQVGEIASVDTAAQHSRFDYVMLFAGLMMSIKKNGYLIYTVDKDFEFSLSEHELLEGWFAVLQCGHLRDSYAAERYLLWKLSECPALRSKFLRLLPDWAKEHAINIIKDLRWRHLHHVLAVWKVSCWPQSQHRTFALAILRKFIELTCDTLTQGGLWRSCFFDFKIMNELCHLQLDSFFAPTGVQIKASDIAQQMGYGGVGVVWFPRQQYGPIIKSMNALLVERMYYTPKSAAARWSFISMLDTKYSEHCVCPDKLETMLHGLMDQTVVDCLQITCEYALSLPCPPSRPNWRLRSTNKTQPQSSQRNPYATASWSGSGSGHGWGDEGSGSASAADLTVYKLLSQTLTSNGVPFKFFPAEWGESPAFMEVFCNLPLDSPQHVTANHLFRTLVEIEKLWKKLNYKGFNDALVQPSRMEPVPMSRVLQSLASFVWKLCIKQRCQCGVPSVHSRKLQESRDNVVPWVLCRPHEVPDVLDKYVAKLKKSQDYGIQSKRARIAEVEGTVEAFSKCRFAKNAFVLIVLGGVYLRASEHLSREMDGGWFCIEPHKVSVGLVEVKTGPEDPSKQLDDALNDFGIEHDATSAPSTQRGFTFSFLQFYAVDDNDLVASSNNAGSTAPIRSAPDNINLVLPAALQRNNAETTEAHPQVVAVPVTPEEQITVEQPNQYESEHDDRVGGGAVGDEDRVSATLHNDEDAQLQPHPLNTSDSPDVSSDDNSV